MNFRTKFYRSDATKEKACVVEQNIDDECARVPSAISVFIESAIESLSMVNGSLAAAEAAVAAAGAVAALVDIW
jgi:hypothetical protein